MLQYLHEVLRCPWIPEVCKWNDKVCDAAARHGHLHCLKYLREQGCPAVYACTYAAQYGHLDCLAYAHEKGCGWVGHLTCTVAASNGRFECLKYAHEHGAPWSAATTTRAAVYGQYECLRYCVVHGCSADDRAMATFRQHCLDV
jgi:hypothetical protein